MEDAAQEIKPVAASGEPQSSKRRRGKLALGCLIALALLLASGVALAPSLIPAEWVSAAVRQGLEEATGRRCQVGAARVGWLDGVAISDFALAGDTPGEPLASADRLVVGASVFSLLKGALAADTVRLEGLTLRLKRYRDGSFNFETVPPAASPTGDASAAGGGGGAGFGLVVRHVSVSGATVIYSDELLPAPVTVKLDTLTLTGEGVNQSYALEGKVFLGVDGKGGSAAFRGTVDLLENDAPDPNGSADLNVDLDALGLAAVAEVLTRRQNPALREGAASGLVTLKYAPDGKLSGSLRNFALSGIAAALPGGTLPECRLALDGAMQLSDRKLLLSGGKLLASGIDGEFSGAVDLSRPEVAGELDVSGNLDCGAGLAAELLDGALASGLVDASGKITFSDTVHADLRVAGRQFSRSLPGAKERLQANLEGRLTADFSGGCKFDLAVEKSALAIPETEFAPAQEVAVSGTITYTASDDAAIFKGVKVALASGELEVSGALKNLGKEERDLAVLAIGTQDAAKLLAAQKLLQLPEGLRVSGATTLSLGAAYRGGSYRVVAKATIPDATVADPEFGLPTANAGTLQLAANFSRIAGEALCRVNSASASCDLFALKLSGAASPDFAAGELSYDASFNFSANASVYAALGAPANLVETVAARGSAKFGQGLLSLTGSTLSGTLKLDQPQPFTLRHDLLLSCPAGQGFRCAVKAATLAVGAKESEILQLELKDAGFVGPFAELNGAAQLTVRGRSRPLYKFLNQLALDYPQAREVLAAFMPNAVSSAFSASGELHSVKGEVAASLATRLAPVTVSGLHAGPQPGEYVIFQDEDTTGNLVFEYSIPSGRFVLKPSWIKTSGKDGVILSYQSSYEPGQNAAAHLGETKVTVNVPNVAKFQTIFPPLVPQGWSYAGAATAAAECKGPLSALDVTAVLSGSGFGVSRGEGHWGLALPDGEWGRLSCVVDAIGPMSRARADGAYGYFADVDVNDFKLRGRGFALGPCLFRGAALDGNLRQGVLGLRGSVADACGQLLASASADFTKDSPPCALWLRTGEGGILLREPPAPDGAPGELSAFLCLLFGEAKVVESGRLLLPDPVAPNGEELRLSWHGLTGAEALDTISSNRATFRLDRICIRMPLKKSDIGEMAGFDQIDQLNEDMLGGVFKFFGAGDKEKARADKGEKVYRYEYAAGALSVMTQDMDFGGKRGRRALATLHDTYIKGGNTADFLAAGTYNITDDYLDIRVTVTDHADRFINVVDSLNRLDGLSGDAVKMRAVLAEALARGLDEATRKGEIYYNVRGPLSEVKWDYSQVKKVALKILDRARKQLGNAALGTLLLDSVLGDKNGDKKDGDGKKDKNDKKKDPLKSLGDLFGN